MIALIGWPLYLYYARPAPGAKKAQALANIPPLPAADDRPAFARLRDKSPADEIDRPAKKLAFEEVRKLSPDELSAKVRREVTPYDLDMHPKLYRGLTIHLEGNAQLAVVHDDEPTLTPSHRYYEIWLNVPDQRDAPVCVLVEDVPPTLPAGTLRGEPVSFDGVFLRLLAYKARDAARFAPLLVGRITHHPEEAAAPRSMWWNVAPLGLLGLYFCIRMAFSLRKGLRRPSERRDFFPKDDKAEIEPEALNQWLAGPAPEVEPGEDERT